MPTNIELLKKLEFNSLEQFLEDLNSNFGIVQTSPLFKGIPGDEGDPGNPGNPGLRGSKFIFINLQKFQEQFPNELSSGIQIDLTYLNSKLLTFENIYSDQLKIFSLDFYYGANIKTYNNL
jgi:hypothetical protein